jgi:hypothetical protein
MLTLRITDNVLSIYKETCNEFHQVLRGFLNSRVPTIAREFITNLEDYIEAAMCYGGDLAIVAYSESMRQHLLSIAI